MPDDRYARHYWRFADEFPDVYGDDAALSLWHRLVRLADMAWPAAASLPFGVRKAALAVLTLDRDGGALIQVIDANHSYRVRGMDKERNRRSEAARVGGIASANARRTPVEQPSNASPTDRQRSVNLAEQSRADKSKAEQSARPTDDDKADAYVAFYDRFARYPAGTIKRWLGDLCENHGEARVAAAINGTPTTDEPNVYLGQIRDALRREDHEAERREAADEKAKIAAKRSAPTPSRISDDPEYRRILAEISKPSEAVS